MRVFVIVGLLTAGAAALRPPAARACSCAAYPPTPPVAFEGTALRALAASPSSIAPTWRFKVLRAERGTEAGSTVDVTVWVPVETPNGTNASSCDVGSEPMRQGLRYRITASVFTDQHGERRLSADQCGGGSVEPLRSAFARSVLTEETDKSSDDALWAVIAVVTVGAAIVVVRRRASRS